MKLLGSTFLRRRLILVFVVDLFLSLFLLKHEKKKRGRWVRRSRKEGRPRKEGRKEGRPRK